MFLQVIVLDAAMSVSDVRARLARYGLWLDAQEPEAQAWIAQNAGRAGQPFEEVAKRLARDPSGFGAAIRRQWSANVLWYSRPAGEVLFVCAAAAPDGSLLDALNLHEPDSRVLGEEAHYIHTYWWNRLVPLRSYVNGWKISPSHYANQDLSTIWLSPPECGRCSAHLTIEHAVLKIGK